MAARFKMEPRFEALLVRSTEVKVMIDGITREVAELAARYAGQRSKTIAASIEAVGGQTASGYRGRVNAWDFKSGWAEFGTSRFPQIRMLGRALEETVGSVRGDAE